jgi:hypothetical protein
MNYSIDRYVVTAPPVCVTHTAVPVLKFSNFSILNLVTSDTHNIARYTAVLAIEYVYF